MNLRVLLDFHELSDVGVQPSITNLWLTYQDLIDGQLGVLLLIWRIVLSPVHGEQVVGLLKRRFCKVSTPLVVSLYPELLVEDSIPKMSALHVLIRLRDRDDEVDVEVVDDVCNESQKNYQASIFEIC
jgi:hypothetical protein